MMMTSMKKMLSLMLCMVLIAAMALGMAGCGSKETAETTGAGEQVSFTFIVVDPEGEETSFEITTEKKMVGEALMDEGLIAGEDGEYGIYVKSVNGITLDWDKDQKYWAFYADDEYSMTGAEVTPIVAGTVYSFRAES